MYWRVVGCSTGRMATLDATMVIGVRIAPGFEGWCRGNDEMPAAGIVRDLPQPARLLGRGCSGLQFGWWCFDLTQLPDGAKRGQGTEDGCEHQRSNDRRPDRPRRHTSDAQP